MIILHPMVVITIIAIISVLFYFKRAYGYWKRKCVNYLEPSIPTGNFENPLFIKKGFLGTLNDAYREFKAKGKRYGGIYLLNKPILIPTDPDLIKSILAKDFSHFMNRGSLIDESEPLTANLFSLKGEKWRNLRAQLTPTFTSGKMKTMFNTILCCCDEMMEHIKQLCIEQKPLYVKDIVSRYTTDVIGCCAFGLDCNSFKNPNAEFIRYGRKFSKFTLWSDIGRFIYFVMPELHKVLKFRIIGKNVSKFFKNSFKEVFNMRISTNFKRNDFVQLLLEISERDANSSKTLNMEEMVAQAFLFFLAGFETSSSNLGFSLYKLAWHQDIQDRVREEILDVLSRHNGELTYESLSEIKYMDQVINETLRLYPPLPFLHRNCTKDYVIPGTDIKIEKGISVMINVLGLHMDEEYYPNPDKFDPDRFTKENKSKRHQYVHIPFGEGPKICIGQRFAILQIKIGLASILKDFKLVPHEDTPKSISYNPKSVLIFCNEDLVLNSHSI